MKKIKLTNGNFTLVDDEDYNFLIKFEWHETHGYARTYFKNDRIRMHRMIMNPKRDQMIDHVDGNKLNNTKSNLRFCVSQQNSWNRLKHKNNKSGVKGVRKAKTLGKWEAQIGINGKNKYLGTFLTLKQARDAYNIAAVKLFGKFANLN